MARDGCEKFGPDLSAYLDGELSAARIRQVETHLVECAACRQTLNQLREVVDRLAELPRMRAPEELAASLRGHAERRALLEAGQPLRRVRLWPRLAKLSASAALLALCVFVGWRVVSRPEPTAPQVARGPEPEVTLQKERGASGREMAPARRMEQTEQVPADELSRLEALGYVNAAEPALANRTDAPAAVPASPKTAPVAPADTIALGITAGQSETGGSVAMAELSFSAEPAVGTIEVSVTPRTYEQYEAAVALVAAVKAEKWPAAEQQQAAELGIPARSPRAFGVEAWTAGASPAPAREVVLTLDADRARDMVAALQERVPKQVRLSASLDQLERLMRTDTADALAPTVQDQVTAAPSDGETALVAGRARIIGGGEQVKDKRALAKGTDRAAEEQTARRPLGGRGRLAEGDADQAERKEHAARTAVPRGAGRGGVARGGQRLVPETRPADETAGEAKERAADLDRKAGALAQEGFLGGGPGAAPAGEAGEPTTQPAQGKSPDGMLRQFMMKLRGTWAELSGRVTHALEAGPTAAPERVLLRVTVLPPPQVPVTTQPTSATPDQP